MTRSIRDHAKLPKRLTSIVAAAGLAIGLALTPMVAQAASDYVEGTMPIDESLVQFSKFRYKPASSTPTYFNMTGYPGWCTGYVRLGLRSTSGTQVTPSQEWIGPGTRYFTTYAGSTLSVGSYAFNGRLQALHTLCEGSPGGYRTFTGTFVY